MDLELLKLQRVVLEKMAVLGFTKAQISQLRMVPLGWLRKSATQRHGVTRFFPGVNLAEGILSPIDVRKVDLHRSLIEEEYADYGEYVLFHEYCHCIGHSGHGAGFKALDRRWPDKEVKAKGKKLTTDLRLRKAIWIWKCPACQRSHPRRRRSNGRYICRKCNVHLIDEPSEGRNLNT